MATTTPHPPIPRQPIGGTFLVAICLLGFIALIQLLAVAVHYSKLVKEHMLVSASQEREEVVEVQETVEAAPTPVPAELLRAQELFVEADRHFRVGEFEQALAVLDEVNMILPNDPSVILRRTEIFEKLDRPAEAVMGLEQVLAVPGLPPNLRAMAEKKLEFLAQRVSAQESAVDNPPSAPAAVSEIGGDDVRDPIGLQPGADLGIVDVRLRDGGSGIKRMRVGVKSRPGTPIVVPDVRIYIYFYEKNERGEVVITDSRVKTEWLSPPVDWNADEPELLLGQYILPQSGLPGSSTANGSSGRTYHGYIVAVYYKRELQDFRSEPAELAQEYPVPLYLPEE